MKALLLCVALAACSSTPLPHQPMQVQAFPAYIESLKFEITDASFAPVTYIDATGFSASCTMFQRFGVIKPGDTLELTTPRPVCSAVKPDAVLKVSDYPWNSFVTCWFRVTPQGVTVEREGADTDCSIGFGDGVTTLTYDLNVGH